MTVKTTVKYANFIVMQSEYVADVVNQTNH